MPTSAGATDRARHAPRPLGQILVERGLISRAELEEALSEQRKTGRRLGEILLAHRLITRPSLARALLDQQGLALERDRGFGSGLFAAIERRASPRLAETDDGAASAPRLADGTDPGRGGSAEARASVRRTAEAVNAVPLELLDQPVVDARLADIEARLAALQREVERLLALEDEVAAVRARLDGASGPKRAPARRAAGSAARAKGRRASS